MVKQAKWWRHCPKCECDLWVQFRGQDILFTEPSDFPCPNCDNLTSTLTSTRPPGTAGIR